MVNNFQLLDIRAQVSVAHVHHIPNFLRPPEIKAIEGMAGEFEFEDGQVLGNNGLNVLIRQSRIKWLSGNQNNNWLYRKILDSVRELNQEFWKFDLYGINESIQYTVYEHQADDSGYFDWHLDFSHEGLPSTRKLTLIANLDDNHEGGEISILLGVKEHKLKLKRGDAILFPSYLINKVYRVTSGKNISIVCWISGPSFR